MKADEIKALAFDEAPNDIVRALCMSWCFSKYIPQNAEQHRAAVLEPAIKAAIDAENEIRRLRDENKSLRATVDGLEAQARMGATPKKADIKRLNALVKSWKAEEEALCRLYGDARPRGRRASTKLDCGALARVLKLLE